MSNEDAIFDMKEPCLCDCGQWFDLVEGNPCDSCNDISCMDCILVPWDTCKKCKDIK